MQDLVQAAFQNILRGGEWAADKPLWLVLEGFIRGSVRNLATSWENRLFTNGDDKVSPDGDDRWLSAFEQFSTDGLSPDDTLIQEEDDDLILNIIESLGEGSPDRLIVEAIFHSGAKKRDQILMDTGLDAKSFEAAKKRLRRFLENYRQERESANH